MTKWYCVSLKKSMQVLELSRNLQNEQSERQRMQDAVDVACVGLERESMALRAEVAAAVAANRVLQAQAITICRGVGAATILTFRTRGVIALAA